MTPRPTTKNGKPCWMADLRAEGHGRIYAETEDALRRKYRRLVVGVDEIEFTDSDRLAKHELVKSGVSGSMLDAVRYYLGNQTTRTRKPLTEAIAECVSTKEKKNRRKAYVAHLDHVLQQFRTFAGDVNCCDVNTKHVNAFLDSRPWAGATVLGMRNRLSAFFGFCVKHGYASKNPVDAVELDSVEKKRPVIFTVEQAHRLLDTALVLDPAMVPFFALGLFCGIRPEELQRLDPNAVRIAESIVDIPAEVSKTRDRRLVELSANAQAWLLACGKPLFYSRRRRRAMIEAARVTWHADVMRHTFASYHIAHHQSADKTALELGHHGNTKMLFKHYKATVTREEAAAFWQLEPVLMPPVLKLLVVNEAP